MIRLRFALVSLALFFATTSAGAEDADSRVCQDAGFSVTCNR